MDVSPADIAVFLSYAVFFFLLIIGLFGGKGGNSMVSRADLAKRANLVGVGGRVGRPVPLPKRGKDIFTHAGGPQTWDAYVGQANAKALLKMAVFSAVKRGEPLDHVLIATGMPGIGKSALARLIAYQTGVGIVEIQGEITGEEAYGILHNMQDGDILFIDEAHKLVERGKAKAEWLLPFLQDGVLITPTGTKEVPDVTVIMVTTDKDRLPEPILDRLPLKPDLTSYTDQEAAKIAKGMAGPIFSTAGLEPLPGSTLAAVARACNNTPRLIDGMLRRVRDAEIAGFLIREGGWLDISPLLKMMDITHDGLDYRAQNMLLALMGNGGSCGMANLAALLGESEIPRLTERLLMTKGLMAVVYGQGGRVLTEAGQVRASELASQYR